VEAYKRRRASTDPYIDPAIARAVLRRGKVELAQHGKEGVKTA
jgi:hypothetical protein